MRNPPYAVIAVGRGSELDLAAVIAQRKPVAEDSDGRSDRVVESESGAVDQERNPAAGILDDERLVKFAVEIVARDDAFERDVLRHGDAVCGAARLEVRNGVHAAGSAALEREFRRPVAGRQQQQERQQFNTCSRFHRGV